MPAIPSINAVALHRLPGTQDSNTDGQTGILPPAPPQKGEVPEIYARTRPTLYRLASQTSRGALSPLENLPRELLRMILQYAADSKSSETDIARVSRHFLSVMAPNLKVRWLKNLTSHLLGSPKLSSSDRTLLFQAIVAEAKSTENPSLLNTDRTRLANALLPAVLLIEGGQAQVECFHHVLEMGGKTGFAMLEAVIVGMQISSKVPQEDRAGFDERLRAMAEQACGDPVTAEKLIAAATGEFSLIVPAIFRLPLSFPDKESEINFTNFLVVLMKGIRSDNEKIGFFGQLSLAIIQHPNFHDEKTPLFFQHEETALAFANGLMAMLEEAETSRMMGMGALTTVVSRLLDGETRTHFIMDFLELVERMRDPIAIAIAGNLSSVIPEGEDRDNFNQRIAQMRQTNA